MYDTFESHKSVSTKCQNHTKLSAKLERCDIMFRQVHRFQVRLNVFSFYSRVDIQLHFRKDFVRSSVNVLIYPSEFEKQYLFKTVNENIYA